MNKELEALKRALRAAGWAVMKFYGQEDLEVRDKGEDNPVSAADLASEKALLEVFSDFGYGLLSEESEDDLKRLKAERVWVMDPLDGTKDFINQTGDFTIMVGLVEAGEVILGGVYKPNEDRLFYAVRGEGAFVEEAGKVRELRVSDRKESSNWRLLVSRFHLRDEEVELSKGLGITEMVKSGSAGLKACRVAADEADLYVNTSEGKTYEWDICAADLIVTEAGGKVTDLDGKVIAYNKRDPRNMRGFLVSNGLAHERVLREIRREHF